MSQAGQEAAFHVDHILPRKSGGDTVLSNLALACVSCSLRKGAALTVQGPRTGEVVPVFHPRGQVWDDHFLQTETRRPSPR
jgi:5-methylcytosine-specific restriction endonuclease McrA